MAIHIEPENGVKRRPAPKLNDLAVKTSAATETAEYLHINGLEIKPNAEDKDIAATLAVSYAEDPEKTSKAATTKRVANLTLHPDNDRPYPKGFWSFCLKVQHWCISLQ